MKPRLIFIALLLSAGCSTTPTALDQWSAFTRAMGTLDTDQRLMTYNRVRDQYRKHPDNAGRLQLAYLQTTTPVPPDTAIDVPDLLAGVAGDPDLETVRDGLRREYALRERLQAADNGREQLRGELGDARQRVLALQTTLEQVHLELETCSMQLEALKNIESEMSQNNHSDTRLQP